MEDVPLLGLDQLGGEDGSDKDLDLVGEVVADEAAVLWVVQAALDQLLDVVPMEIDRPDVDVGDVRNHIGIVEVLPADDRPLLCLIIGNLLEDPLDQAEVVDLSAADVHLGQLLAVLDLREAPEELDAHEVGPILGVEADRDVVGLAPGHHVVMDMRGGVVHIDRPLVAIWQRLLGQDHGRFDGLVGEGSVLTVHVDLSQAAADEPAACHVVRCLGLLPVPWDRLGLGRPCVLLGIALDEYALVELEDVIAAVLEVDEALLCELDVLLLLLDLVDITSGRPELLAVALEGDAVAIVELLEVPRAEIAALCPPLVVVDGDALEEGVGGMPGERLSADDLLELGLRDVEDPGVPLHGHILHPDALHAGLPKDIDQLHELVPRAAQCPGGGAEGDVVALIQELLAIWVPGEEEQQRRLQVDLPLVGDGHRYLPGLPMFIGLVLFHFIVCF